MELTRFVCLIYVTLSASHSQYILAQTENTKTDKTLKTSGDILERYTDLDAKSCRCIPPTERCKLSIAKSSLQEINCPGNEHYCCDESKKPEEEDAARIQIHIVAADVPESESQSRAFSSDSDQRRDNDITIITPTLRCNCRARQDCEDKYTDYTFGFHCSYDKVRCCEPLEEIERKLNEKAGGRLIQIPADGKLIQIPANDQTLNDQNGYQCFCVTSKEECANLNFKIVSDEEGDNCPYQSVKCCGISMHKKSDTDIELEEAGSDDLAHRWNVPADTDDPSTQGAGVNIHGQPGFRQPIQLPVLKVPLNDTTPSRVSSVPSSSGPTEVVNSPPELPYSYHEVRGQGPIVNVPPASNFYQQGVQRPPISQYYGNVGPGPYRYENSAPMPYRFNVNAPPGVAERSGQPQSIWEKVSNFFTG